MYIYVYACQHHKRRFTLFSTGYPISENIQFSLLSSGNFKEGLTLHKNFVLTPFIYFIEQGIAMDVVVFTKDMFIVHNLILGVCGTNAKTILKAIQSENPGRCL